MKRIRLTADEVEQISVQLEELAATYDSTEDPKFHCEAPLRAHDLPRRLRKELLDFRLQEPPFALFLLSNCPVDDERLGPTPARWGEAEGKRRSIEIEMLLVLAASVLGECVAWSTQQDGALVHDVLPIKGQEKAQMGCGCEEPLLWHTEDAFHPYRGDYLGMACLRNPDRVPTTFLPVGSVELDPLHFDLLSQPLFTIRPDQSHLRKNNSADRVRDPSIADSYSRIEQMNDAPEKLPVLFGDQQAPYLRIDPYFMDPVGDPAAQEALDALISSIDSQIQDVVLEPGDVCFIDNYQSVHGRRSFNARFDGTDRWLKRVNVVRDLRKSRAMRASAESRLIL